MADNDLYHSEGIFADHWYDHVNGRQYANLRDHAIYNRSHGNSLPNRATIKKRVEISLFVKTLLWVGLGAYLGGVLLNWATWKGDLMTIIGALFIVSRLIFYWIKQGQERYRRKLDNEMRELEVREKKRYLDIGDPL